MEISQTDNHGAKRLEYRSVKSNSTAFWKLSKIQLLNMTNSAVPHGGAKIKLGWWVFCLSRSFRVFCMSEMNMWKESYTGLQVVNGGISFLTRADPSANAWNPHSSVSLSSYILTTPQLSFFFPSRPPAWYLISTGSTHSLLGKKKCTAATNLHGHGIFHCVTFFSLDYTMHA